MASESINNQTVNILIMLAWQPQKNRAVLHMFGKTLVNEYVAIKTLCSDDYKTQLEQLECLRSEIPLTAPWMITHTSDSHQIPSQNKTKSKLQN